MPEPVVTPTEDDVAKTDTGKLIYDTFMLRTRSSMFIYLSRYFQNRQNIQL